MKITFYKYHGTGNDFILIDNRELLIDSKNKNLFTKLCDRHFGIGADGLILLEPSKKYDFYMRYYNADGLEASMCGNGGRCVVAFAKRLKIIQNKTQFEAIDGLHTATIEATIVSLQMADVAKLETHESHYFLDTGSPHHVSIVTGLDTYPVAIKGREIRYAAPYYETGSNVNFVEQTTPNTFKVRTYERGVEDETLSCGTGVTAVAIAMFAQKKTTSKTINLKTLGGDLEVSFRATKSSYSSIFLKGTATFVFNGILEI